MTDILKKIDNALDRMKKGTFTGSVIDLLSSAREGLAIQYVVKERVEVEDAQEAWEIHNRFKERLETILEEHLKVEELQEGERLMWCYVTSFYATPKPRDEGEPTITIREADIRIATDEEKAPEHTRIERSDRYGCQYRDLRKHMWTFPERWLWEDDWKDQLKRRALEIGLNRARYKRREAIEYRMQLEKETLPAAKQRVLNLSNECGKIVRQMGALGMEVPAEEEE